MKCVRIILVLFCVLTVQTYAAKKTYSELYPLEDMFDGKGAPWNLSVQDFVKQYYTLRFHWGSAKSKDVMKLMKGAVSLMDEQVVEVTVKVKGDNVSEIIMSLYNRGDMGNLSEHEFTELISLFSRRISTWLKVRSVKTKGVLSTAGTVKEGLVWTRKPDQFKMEWSWTKANRGKGYPYRAEYIKLMCHKYDRSTDYSSSILANKLTKGGTVSASRLKQSLAADDNGDVFISGIPMVDQGQKGYCVVATIERILRYYGRDVDQHELAQMANSIGALGTRISDMIDALRKIGVELGFKVTIYEDWTWQKYQKRVKDYSRMAKMQGKHQIVLPRSGTINIAAIDASMETEILRAARLGDKANYKKFMTNIKSNIKRGIPLVWSVTTGRVSEKPPILQMGHHMRMIVGYNEKTSEILYSDTWGPGHEKKRMSADDAWMITDGLYVLLPRRMSS